MFQAPLLKVGSAPAALSVGIATFFAYLPAVMGSLASLAAIIWIGIQAYYFIKAQRNKD